MQSPIEAKAAANAEYTGSVIQKAADIIEDLGAAQQTWNAREALERADRELRSRNRHSEIWFSLTAVINSLDRHLRAKHHEEHGYRHDPWTPVGALSPGPEAETVAEVLRTAAPEVAKEVYSWTIRTEEVLEQIAQLGVTEEDVMEAVREVKGK